MQQIVAILGARVNSLAGMDRRIHGMPPEWPDEVFQEGSPVWVEVQGLPQFGIMPGGVGFCDLQHDRVKGGRHGRVGITVGKDLPITGHVTYAGLHDFNFWPRSVEVSCPAKNVTELVG